MRYARSPKGGERVSYFPTAPAPRRSAEKKESAPLPNRERRFFVMRARPLALPPGERSPLVTERFFRRWCGQCPRPLRLRFAQPPLPEGEARTPARGTRPLALPLGELSPPATERFFCRWCGHCPRPLRPRCAQPPLPKGEARDARTGHRPLALPPGELSPQVTERVFPSLVRSLSAPSPSSLRSATSPFGRAVTAGDGEGRAAL